MTGFARLHALLVDDDTLAQVCRDLPESACRAQPHNYGVHVTSCWMTFRPLSWLSQPEEAEVAPLSQVT